jgi:hypothetical protein
MQPILVNCRELVLERLVQKFDDAIVALHAGLLVQEIG